MSEQPDSEKQKRAEAYWKANRSLIITLLVIWAVVSYGCSILFAEALSGFKVGKLPLSFWFAQQGAMVIFVVLIWVYARRMDTIDRDHDMHEEE